MNKLEWCIIRSSIDSVLNPISKSKRRFSDALIAEEQSKLYRFREIHREVMRILKQNRKEYGNIEKFGGTKERRYQSIISMI
jgi:Mg2+ and Co2+ transporter CorA